MEEKIIIWEVHLKDGNVIREVDGNKFDLKWELPGEVKKFILKDNGIEYSVNLENGEFSYDNQIIIPEGFNGSFGDYSLKYFKRNQIFFNTMSQPIGKSLKYFFGYSINGKEKLLKISPEGNMFSDK